LGMCPVLAADLPPEVQSDRLYLQAEKSLASKDYLGAVGVMSEMIALQEEHGFSLPTTFHFRHAQASLFSGSIQTASASVTKYLREAGRQGKFYNDALLLLDEIDTAKALLDQYPAVLETLTSREDFSGAMELIDRVLELKRVYAFSLPDEFNIQRSQVNRLALACARVGYDAACWMPLSNQDECYTWKPAMAPRLDTAKWSANCVNGLVSGYGTLSFGASWNDTKKFEVAGSFHEGKPHGECVVRDRDANSRGTYARGIRHGHWIEKDAHGGVEEGPYRDGQRHGAWTLNDSYRRSTGTFVEGVRQGRWVISSKTTDWEAEGPFVDGKRDGVWVVRTAHGSNFGGPYVADERHGRWRLPPTRGLGATTEGIYVKGKKHGRWTYRWITSGQVDVKNYVNGRIVR
ncbi:MAG: hypothetical protein OXG44_01225, partial [Gammaproteobacteria bacterium]|nr:hypothetical protein [Gammaproteobacteria bacterium]